jgi:ankyrin repeat protein
MYSQPKCRRGGSALESWCQVFLLFEGASLNLSFLGADPNLPSKKGVTPISAAAHKGNVALMQPLIDAGAVVNTLNSSGSTALIQVSVCLLHSTCILYIFVVTM